MAQERSAAPRLLNDELMQKFVADGFLVLPLTDHTLDFHNKVWRDARNIFERSGQAEGGVGKGGLKHGNDIFPAIPELGDVMVSPTIAGALQSVLGPGYTMNDHRHMHHSKKSGQTYHKDTQRGKPPPHLPRALFIFYYPAGVTDSMGPTEIIPGSQYLSADDQNWDLVNHSCKEVLGSTLSGKRVTTSKPYEPVAVMAHFGFIHRATPRLSDEDDKATPWRPMMKFIFDAATDLERPGRVETANYTEVLPMWNHRPEAVRPFAEFTATPELIPAMQTQWEWLLSGCGRSHNATAQTHATAPSADVMATLRESLLAPSGAVVEAQRVGAAYELGRIARTALYEVVQKETDEREPCVSNSDISERSQTAMGALLRALHGRSGRSAQRVAVQGLIAAGPAAVEGLRHALWTSNDDTVLMFAADSLSDAMPRTDRSRVAQAKAALQSASGRLNSMVAASPRLKAWAAASAGVGNASLARGLYAKGRTDERQQWDFAEDTALKSCKHALAKCSLQGDTEEYQAAEGQVVTATVCDVNWTSDLRRILHAEGIEVTPLSSGRSHCQNITNDSKKLNVEVSETMLASTSHSHCQNTLKVGEKLNVNEFLRSKCGHYTAIMQSDGNFCVYRDGRFLFGTVQKGGYKPEESDDYSAVMQVDGNFCVYKGSQFKFGSAESAGYSACAGDYRLVMQNDGNLCVYKGSEFKFGTVQAAGYKTQIFA